MAILDRPLFGDEARGRIKNTLVFIKRTANLGYDGIDPGFRFIVNQLKSFRQCISIAREEVKEKFKEGITGWKELTPAEKEAYWAAAEGLQTNFNVYMKEYLLGEEEVDEMPVGGILAYGGASAPEGYLMCDGAAISRTTYAALFAVTGTSFGVGNGTTTFNLPDLQQRFPLGKAVSGTGSVLGAIGGEINHFHMDTGHAHNLFSGNDLGPSEYSTHGAYTEYSYSSTDTKNPPFQAVNFIIKF